MNVYKNFSQSVESLQHVNVMESENAFIFVFYSLHKKLMVKILQVKYISVKCVQYHQDYVVWSKCDRKSLLVISSPVISNTKFINILYCYYLGIRVRRRPCKFVGVNETHTFHVKHLFLFYGFYIQHFKFDHSLQI